MGGRVNDVFSTVTPNSAFHRFYSCIPRGRTLIGAQVLNLNSLSFLGC